MPHHLLLARDIIQNLREFFQVSVAQDEARIQVVVKMLDKARCTNWQAITMARHDELIEHLARDVPLLQIAVDLEVPIDELEKCLTNLSEYWQYRARQLDSDLPMYRRFRKDRQLTPRAIRGEAYHYLLSLEELRPYPWAVRMILVHRFISF